MRPTHFLAIIALMLFSSEITVGQSVLTQLEQRLQGTAAPAGPAAAPAANGYLGAGLDDDEQGKGVRVTEVKAGAPAETGGLKADDLITTINGKQVKTVEDYDKLASGPPGTKLQMTVERGGRPQLLTVILGTKPAVAADQNPGETPPPALAPPTTSPSAASPSASAPSLIPPTGPSSPATPTAPAVPDAGARGSGIRATPLDLPPPPESSAPPVAGGGGASLGIRVESFSDVPRGSSIAQVRRGAVITQVKPGSPAANAGLTLGAVIVKIDGRRVDTSDDLVSAIQAARPGQEVELTYYEGDRISRKSIRLAAAGSAPGASSPATAPSAPGAVGGLSEPTRPSFPAPPSPYAPFQPSPGGGVGRSLLQQIEQMADNLTRPTGTTTVYDPLAMAALQTRVVEMTEQMKAFENRLKAIESKLGISGGSATPTPASAPTTPGFGSPTAPSATPGFGSPAGTGTNP